MYRIRWNSEFPNNGQPNSFVFAKVEENLYFGSKPLKLGSVSSPETNLAVDRLGSIRRSNKDYFPYGQEAPTTTAGDKEKYATYRHDAATDLSYADQRYYATGAGRFITADPFEASAGPEDPGSWNRYSYVNGDPVGFLDPNGLLASSADTGGGGGSIAVYNIPGLIFRVFKTIFSGSPKDLIAEPWKSNPAAQGAAVNARIAQAAEEGGQQDRRYIAALKVVDDCYTQSTIGGTLIRRFTYQAVDQYGQGFTRGEYSVTEQNAVVRGSLTSGNATWGPSQMRPDGTFRDYVGKQLRAHQDVVQYQTFTATMLNSAGFQPGVPRQVMIQYDGYGSGTFGVWGHWMTNDGVRTNDYFYHPGRPQDL